MCTQVSSIAIQALRIRLGRNQIPDRLQPDAEAFREWKIWSTNVFMPLNELLESLVLKSNSHLIREQEMPECLLNFVAHSCAYKTILKKWEDNDFSEYLSIIDFPPILGDTQYGHIANSNESRYDYWAR